jgi:hypothetical protein
LRIVRLRIVRLRIAFEIRNSQFEIFSFCGNIRVSKGPVNDI